MEQGVRPTASGRPIELHFGVTDVDQRQMVRAVVMRHPLVRFVRIAAIAAPPVMIAWSMSAGWTLPQAIFRNTFWIVFAILELFLFLPYTVRASVKAARQADPNWAESQSVSIDDAAIRLVSPSSTTEIAWDGVEEATETRGMLLVWFRAKKVFYIPAHAMQAPGTRDAVRSMLRMKLGERAHLSA